MKLNEVYNTPLCEVVKLLELSDMKIHSDDNGDVKSIELKYVIPDKGIDENQTNNRPFKF